MSAHDVSVEEGMSLAPYRIVLSLSVRQMKCKLHHRAVAALSV